MYEKIIRLSARHWAYHQGTERPACLRIKKKKKSPNSRMLPPLSFIPMVRVSLSRGCGVTPAYLISGCQLRS